ncbi:MAG: hypothetical protein IT293_20915 [Deltaproteobacteria bacterium]|nr:hypothetical protein [Deltaproteobacteria bacterium]
MTTAPSHAEPPGTVAAGHCAGNPIAEGVKSPTPLHSLSAPPHALQVLARFFVSALAMAAAALPSPGSGQGFVAFPAITNVQHLARAFDFAT